MSALSEGLWSRFYEIGTNKPIYGDVDGEVHYTLEEISEERQKGYSWQSSFGIPGAIREYRYLMDKGVKQYRADQAVGQSAESQRQRLRNITPEVAAIIGALDDQGRWIDEKGFITCKMFNLNMRQLLDYIELSGE